MHEGKDRQNQEIESMLDGMLLYQIEEYFRKLLDKNSQPSKSEIDEPDPFKKRELSRIRLRRLTDTNKTLTHWISLLGEILQLLKLKDTKRLSQKETEIQSWIDVFITEEFIGKYIQEIWARTKKAISQNDTEATETKFFNKLKESQKKLSEIRGSSDS